MQCLFPIIAGIAENLFDLAERKAHLAEQQNLLVCVEIVFVVDSVSRRGRLGLDAADRSRRSSAVSVTLMPVRPATSFDFHFE
jgi:hypothetical protein